MKNEPKDVKELKPCKDNHRFQWTEKDRKGEVWQYCVGCDRKLTVR